MRLIIQGHAVRLRKPVVLAASRGAVSILIAVLLAVLFAREGLSRHSFDKIHAKDPSLNRLTWRINWLLFFALPPGLLALYGGAAVLVQ